MQTAPPLYYEDTGSGPVVVLLHGYLASSRYWEQLQHELACCHRVIAMDLLGFGKSPKPAASTYDYEAQINSINATLKVIGISQPFTLVGHSMGSLVSLRYAREYPARIHKLMLTNLPVLLDKLEARREIMNTNIFYRIGLRRGTHSIIWNLFKLVTYMRLLPTRVSENAASRRTYMFQSTGTSRLRSLQNIIYEARVEADLQAVSTSTILISGLQDRRRYIQNIARLKVQKNIKLLNVTGGHHLPLTEAALLASYI